MRARYVAQEYVDIHNQITNEPTAKLFEAGFPIQLKTNKGSWVDKCDDLSFRKPPENYRVALTGPCVSVYAYPVVTGKTYATLSFTLNDNIARGWGDLLTVGNLHIRSDCHPAHACDVTENLYLPGEDTERDTDITIINPNDLCEVLRALQKLNAQWSHIRKDIVAQKNQAEKKEANQHTTLEEDIEDLKACIKHWKEDYPKHCIFDPDGLLAVRFETGKEANVRNCALCMRHVASKRKYDHLNDCGECPLYTLNGNKECQCGDTAYNRAVMACTPEQFDIAQRNMIAVLEAALDLKKEALQKTREGEYNLEDYRPYTFEDAPLSFKGRFVGEACPSMPVVMVLVKNTDKGPIFRTMYYGYGEKTMSADDLLHYMRHLDGYPCGIKK